MSEETATLEKVLEVINSCATPEQLESASQYANLWVVNFVKDQMVQVKAVVQALQDKRAGLGITPEEEQKHV